MVSDVLEGKAAANAVVWELPRLGAGAAAPRTARELDEVERSAHQEGFDHGRKEGYAEGRKDALKHIAQLKQVLARFARPLADLEDEVDHILVHLATTVAGALTRGLSARHPDIVADLVKQTVATLPASAREVDVQLHPDDLAAVQVLLREAGELPTRITANPMLARGDVRVNSDLVRLDATLTTRLANAMEALLDKGTPT